MRNDFKTKGIEETVWQSPGALNQCEVSRQKNGFPIDYDAALDRMTLTIVQFNPNFSIYKYCVYRSHILLEGQ